MTSPHAHPRTASRLTGLRTWLRRAASIRGKILIAFIAMSAITGIVGYFATLNMTSAGLLVAQTYDKPLMSISFARAIHADFATMEAAFYRRLIAHNAQEASDLDKIVEARTGDLADDIAVAARRATSDKTRKAVAHVEEAVAKWHLARAKVQSQNDTAPDWQDFDNSAAVVREQIDLLVNYAAGDGFQQRKRALTVIDENRLVQIGGVLLAVLLSAGVAFSLARRIVKPVAAASEVAGRIAKGELDVDVPVSGSDELASLLSALSVMRDSIKSMMDREIAQRRSAQSRLVDAIESSLEGVILVDHEDQIVLANSQAERFFGAAADAVRAGGNLAELVDRSIERGVFKTVTAQERATLAIWLKSDATMAEMEAKLSDGRWLRLARSRTSDGGHVFILSDITLSKEREIVLREAKDRAEAASRAKSEFLATMGHELRTPLNAVIGFSELISMEAFGPAGNPKYKEFAGDIHSSGLHLLAVINDILDLAKSEAGKLQIEISPIDAGELLESCRPMVIDQFTRAGVDLEIVLPPDGTHVMADRVKARQILLNLLSNAVKFTATGGHVRLATEIHESTITLSVSDTGIGMREEDIPLALAPFGQIDSRLARKYEGTGLGLPLTKALVDLHGGELQIESELGKGTTVKVTLPRAGAQQMPLARAG